MEIKHVYVISIRLFNKRLPGEIGSWQLLSFSKN